MLMHHSQSYQLFNHFKIESTLDEKTNKQTNNGERKKAHRESWSEKEFGESEMINNINKSFDKMYARCGRVNGDFMCAKCVSMSTEVVDMAKTKHVNNAYKLLL